MSGVLSCASISAAQTKPTESNNEQGSVCVLPNSSEPPTRISPGGDYNPKTLTLRIDKQEPIRWPHTEPAVIDGLDLRTNHLVVLTSDGKRIHSFRFKFGDDDGAKLCIYFDGYQGVQLREQEKCRLVQGKGSGLLAINLHYTQNALRQNVLLYSLSLPEISPYLRPHTKD